MLEIEARLHADHAAFLDELTRDLTALARDGHSVNLGKVEVKPSHGGYGFTGPTSEIIIHLDPETAKALLEYAVAALAAHRGLKAFFDKFFEGALGEIGKQAGKATANVIEWVWGRLYDWSRQLKHNRRHAVATFDLVMLVEDVPVTLRNSINPDRVNEVDARAERRAFDLLIVAVLPLVRRQILALRDAGAMPAEVCAQLVLPIRNLDRFNPDDVAWRSKAWHWHIYFSDELQFAITNRGKEIRYQA